MLFLLDTNAISDLIRENKRIEGRIAALAPTDSILTCTIARGEILYGIERLAPGRKRSDLSRKAAALFATIPCEAVLESAAQPYAITKAACQRAGLSLDENDLWIAATAVALGATLVSRDSDFQKVSHLVVQDWTV